MTAINIKSEDGCIYVGGGDIQTSKKHASVDIYPNPTSGTLKINLETANIVNIGIYDCLGKLIYEDSFKGYYRELDLSNQPEGF